MARGIASTGSEVSRRGAPKVHPRVRAMLVAARFFGVDLDPERLPAGQEKDTPSAAELSQWAQGSGMWARAVRLKWKHLLRISLPGPVVLLLNSGGAVLLTGIDAKNNLVLLRDPLNDLAETSPVDELRLMRSWTGEAVLLRPHRGFVQADAPFDLKWLASVVLTERKSLIDIAIGSTALSLLTVFPPLLVMATVNRVLEYQSISTLTLIATMLLVVVVFEAFLTHSRRVIMAVVGARIDARLSLHVFGRLLQLPLEYFEKNPSGETLFRIGKIYQIRSFLTGKLLATGLDAITLIVLMPVLFYMSPALATVVLVCALAMLAIILLFLPAIRSAFGRVVYAETQKYGTLGETVQGIKTVKSLALEPQRQALWDERVADAGKWHLAMERIACWPQTLTLPLERMMTMGTLLLGAYWALSDSSGYLVGSLFAFMMLSGRVAAPLTGFAKLVEDLEEVGASVHEVAHVLNRPKESQSGHGGLRPSIDGAIAFNNVTFCYPGSKLPALDNVSFSIPAGTMLGVVGRSGSGKSTITRLLQGINREYTGFIRLDGHDLKEIDLRHLRSSLGVVLQDNFLFRGSIRENITAGRPGLSLADAVQAARLAGAEEFIERMPNGYETYIEEGSPNLSGGQKQRLAIARGLIHDPRILILDEATSALDPESEAIVNANILRIASGRTMVIVSHRLSSLTDCDQILVMDQGKLVDIGPHEDLLERCAIYRQLWKQQHRHMDTPERPRPVQITSQRMADGEAGTNG